MRFLDPLSGTLQAQVHFTDVSNNAFTIHRRPLLAASPVARRRAVTRLVFDPVDGQVLREICTSDFVPTYCSILCPLTNIGGSL